MKGPAFFQYCEYWIYNRVTSELTWEVYVPKSEHPPGLGEAAVELKVRFLCECNALGRA